MPSEVQPLGSDAVQLPLQARVGVRQLFDTGEPADDGAHQPLVRAGPRRGGPLVFLAGAVTSCCSVRDFSSSVWADRSKHTFLNKLDYLHNRITVAYYAVRVI